MCSAAKLNWPMKTRIVYGISEMVTTHDIVNDVLREDKQDQMWLVYPCTYTTSGQHLLKTGMFDSRQWKELPVNHIINVT